MCPRPITSINSGSEERSTSAKAHKLFLASFARRRKQRPWRAVAVDGLKVVDQERHVLPAAFGLVSYSHWLEVPVDWI